MSEDEARAWLLANGWTVETASLYDEEGVEGWRWSHPDRMIDLCEIGDWSDPPPVPSELMRIAEDATKGDHAMTELLPCPFCGGKPYLANVAMVGCAYVVCTDCRIQGDDGSQERAIAAWNRRAPVWQPIATAPKDGTRVDLWHSANGRIPDCRHVEAYSAVTHWQPLPAPPQEPTNE